MTETRTTQPQAREARLTPDLLVLHARRPRDTWDNLPHDSLARTWLAMHDSLRHGQAMLERLATHWQLKLIDADTFRDQAVPILQQHLGHLHGHHRLEDTHYFPQFRAMEPRIGKGIDLLEGDHASLHRSIDVLEDLTRHLASSGPGDREAGTLIQPLVLALHRLGPEMRRHLLDEEDLVIPLLAIADGHPSNPSHS